eukprot:310090-Pleurochrysis_carterae.AAC.5
MIEGPARRRSRHLCAWMCNASRSQHMPVVHSCGQRPCEHVGNVVVGVYLVHLDEPVRDVLSHLEVTSINMSRALTRAALLGQLDRSAVVD